MIQKSTCLTGSVVCYPIEILISTLTKNLFQSYIILYLRFLGQAVYMIVIGASLSEPHIDELHVRNLYIYILL